MNNDVLTKLTNLQNKKKDLISSYHQIEHQKHFNYIKEKKILDDFNLYEKNLNELEELINNFKILI